MLFAYTVIFLTLFFSVADQALGHAGRLPASPTLLCLLLLSPFALLVTLRHLHSPHNLGPITTLKHNASVLLPFCCVALFALIFAILPGAVWSEGGKWVFLIPYGLCITSAATILGNHRIINSALPSASFISLLILASSVWYDTIYPGTFAPITNRPAGFSGNANFTSLVAVLVCAAGIDLGVRSRNDGIKRGLRGHLYNLILLLFTFSIVCMTMSRSGLVVFTALVVIALYYRFFRTGLSRSRLIAEILAISLAAFLALGFAVTFAQMSSDTQGNSRLTRLLNNQRVDDGSADTRLAAVVEGIDLIEAAPILGHGTGFSRTMSELPHNIYLQQWINNGVLGLISYLALLGCAFITFLNRGSRNGVALILVATIGGLFSHNILDQRPFLILLGVLLGKRSGSIAPANLLLMRRNST
jgi:O-antigen ligase